MYVNESAIAIEPLPEPEKPKLIPLNGAVDLSERQHIATVLLGAIDWQSETSGFLACPGNHLHTTGNNERDCKIWVGDKVPTLHCFHNHCRGILDGINHKLRSLISKAEPHARQNAEPSVDVEEPEIELPTGSVSYASPPLEIFSQVVRDYIQASAETLNVDVAYICNPLISSIGAAIGNSRVIRLKKGFRQPPIFWTANVGQERVSEISSA